MEDKTRTLGQRAMLALVGALSIKSVAVDPASIAGVLPIKLTDGSNLVVIVGLYGIFTTIYFVLRTLNEDMAKSVDFDVSRHLSGKGPLSIAKVDGDTIDNTSRANTMVSVALSIFEFWLPVLLAAITAVAIFGDVPNFVSIVLLNKR